MVEDPLETLCPTRSEKRYWTKPRRFVNRSPSFAKSFRRHQINRASARHLAEANPLGGPRPVKTINRLDNYDHILGTRYYKQDAEVI